jgi:hypothetical protein
VAKQDLTPDFRDDQPDREAAARRMMWQNKT